MNIIVFSGRLADTPKLETHGETKLARFRLIRNEYAGKNADGSRKERQVSVPFTAFRHLAELLAKNALVGDQITVRGAIRNNNYTTGEGDERYDYNFDVEEIEFGAPGQEKRKRLASA